MIRERWHLLVNFGIMVSLGVLPCIPGLVPWYLIPLNIAGIVWFGMMVGSTSEKIMMMKGKGMIER